MPPKICLSVDTIGFPEGGGHAWAYLNWALGFKSIGCDLTWMESPESDVCKDLPAHIAALRQRLAPYGLADSIGIWPEGQDANPRPDSQCLSTDEVLDADLLLNLKYSLQDGVVRRFRRSALLDIDPGLTQTWMYEGSIQVAPHDLYFTIGETVGTPAARFPDVGFDWHRTRPCVALDWWPVCPVSDGGAFRTVSNWYTEDWMVEGEESYRNNKRAGFLPYFDLPRHTSQKLELALCISYKREDVSDLESRGWCIRQAEDVAGDPSSYQSYIQQAKGEFSCCKPSCIRMQNAWVSDRTICFLASGKPAVVQHTGPSSYLPEEEGLLRFHDPESAARLLDKAAAEYPKQCRLARNLAEEFFDARKVAAALLEYL